MPRHVQLVAVTTALMFLLTAISGPISVRLLRHAAALSGPWLIIALAAYLASVLLLAVTVLVSTYLVSRFALVEAEANE